MEQYKLPSHNNPDKVFIVNRSELEGRLEPKFYTSVYLENEDKLANSSFSLVTIKDVTSIVSDGTHFTPNYVSKGVKFISVKDVRQSSIDLGNTKFITEEEADFLDKRCKPQKEDILLTKVGTIGLAAVVNTAERFQIFVSLALLRPKSNILSNYLEIFLNSSIAYLQYDRIVKGAGVPDLHLEDIRRIKLPLAPLKQQQKIVNLYQEAYEQKQRKEAEAKALLDGIDGYLLGELGIALPEKDNSLQKRVFTTQFSEITGGRFDGYFYQEEFIEFFKLLSNSKYPVLSLKHIANKITSGITPLSGGRDYTTPNNGIPFVRSGNINIDGDLNFDDLLYITKEIHSTQMKSSQLKLNDLLIAIVGATIGQVGIYLDDREANINQAIAAVRLNNGCNPFYVKEVLKSSIGQYNLNRLKRPVARANINLEEISTMQIVVPPIEKQNEIAQHIQNIREQAKKLQNEAKAILEQAKQEVELMILG